MAASGAGKVGLDDMLMKFGLLLECPREIWIVYLLKFLEALAYFCGTFVMVKFLSEEIGMSDMDAGWLYGAYGMMISVFGLILGFLVDNLGVRMSLLSGGMLLLVSRIIIAFGTSALQMASAFLVIMPVGCALAIPVQTMALRRYTDERSRQFAFSLFYVCMNISAAVAAFLVDGMRHLAEGGVILAGMHMSMYRLVLLASVVCTALSLALIGCIREIHRNRDGSVEEFRPREGSATEIAQEVFSEPKFWRFFAISVIFVGVRSNFHHMDATFPKYSTREFDEDFPFELLMSINPILIIFLVPFFTYLIDLLKLGFSEVLIIGSVISGISPFALAVSNSIPGTIVWLVLLSIGEAIWSPKLLEFSVAVAPEGREGTYMSLAGAPLFFSKLGVGGLSGYLLSEYCPEEGPRNSQMMWFIIGLTTFLPSVLLMLFNRNLILSEDWEDQKQSLIDSSVKEGSVSEYGTTA